VAYRDVDRAIAASAPVSVGFVLLATFLVLCAAFRCWLVPLKAILLNALSVGAGVGAMVAVFLLGWGTSLVGLSGPVDAIPQSLLVIVFCVVFGLSMDYEVFLISRIKEAYDATGDNTRATVEGVAHTGGIITSAAAVMLAVFGAFIAADVPVVKMLGVGLFVAVAVDATLVRCVAAPAIMRLAGHWNWHPGGRRDAGQGSRGASDLAA
jgi:RND superfamily putative drug exporter